jgi:prepilin-type N-terminal cleavage/methylation domain-containing protein
MADKNQKTFRGNRGFSIIELLVVVGVVALLTAIAVPAMVNQRRLLRSNSVGREIMAQMRIARQLAMSERQSVTFEYNDTTKQIRIINHHNNHGLTDPLFAPACVVGRKEILVAVGYPSTACSGVVSTYSLAQGGLPASEITWGIPTGSPPLPAGAPALPLPTVPLGDSILITPLIPAGVGGKLFITFQNDGSVINNAGLPQNTALFFFNNKAAQATASAISVVGASGRVKVWRYQLSGNSYIE